MPRKTAIIIGAGPAGLTAAYELLHKTDVKPIIFEMSDLIGGISRTVNYKGNRIDIGGHRFFSKSDRVMDWWLNIMPVQGAPARDQKEVEIGYHLKSGEAKVARGGPDPDEVDLVMLIRNRVSRIFFLRKFFNYPITLDYQTFSNLGPLRIAKIGTSYVASRLFPIKEEKSLEDFFINRFGKELYRTFFEDYTEKVWGVPCKKIKPEWGAQRIKGLSISKAILHALKKIFERDNSIKQKGTETSLIEQFLYPKFGPGQMWNRVAEIIREKGGEIYTKKQVTGIVYRDEKVAGVKVTDRETGQDKIYKGDYFFSTMPVKDLIASFDRGVPDEVERVASGLVYRDFMTVGLLLEELNIKNKSKYRTDSDLIPDNWIYIQERDVKLGRLQVFNNWSPYLVKNPDNIWLGLEYFCNQGDQLWSMKDSDFSRFAIDELSRIGIIEKEKVLDNVVIRMPKTYPAYFGTYDEFHVIREFTDRIENLFLVGRNGMHRYNNQDHSMLTSITAVENIVNGVRTKDNIWAVNTEQEYHEVKKQL